MEPEIIRVIILSLFYYFVSGVLVFLGIDIYVKLKTGKIQTHTLKELPIVLVIFLIWPLYLMFWIALMSENKRNNSMYKKENK